MLDISGPCMFMDQRTTIVKCRFNKDDNLITYGIKINSMKARCPVPLMNVRGWITIEMSINSRPFIYSTRILIGIVVFSIVWYEGWVVVQIKGEIFCSLERKFKFLNQYVILSLLKQMIIVFSIFPTDNKKYQHILPCEISFSHF